MNNGQTPISQVIFTLLVVLFLAPTGNADEVNGHVSGSQKELSSIALENGQVVRRILFHLGVITDTQEAPFHGANQQCLATYIFAADGALVKARGGCDGIDPDGDVWWMTFTIEGDGPVRWRNVDGTGKYAGLESSGTTDIISEWGDGLVIGRFEGTYSER